MSRILGPPSECPLNWSIDLIKDHPIEWPKKVENTQVVVETSAILPDTVIVKNQQWNNLTPVPAWLVDCLHIHQPHQDLGQQYVVEHFEKEEKAQARPCWNRHHTFGRGHEMSRNMIGKSELAQPHWTWLIPVDISSVMSMINPMINVARNFRDSFNSLVQTLRPPTPSPIDTDSRFDNPMTATHTGARWATESCCLIIVLIITPCTSPCQH